jgi:hypothetical protein
VHLTELHIVQHQSPHIVAKTVGVQFGGLECDAGLDTLGERGIDRLVELEQHLESKLWCDLAVLVKRERDKF